MDVLCRFSACDNRLIGWEKVELIELVMGVSRGGVAERGGSVPMLDGSEYRVGRGGFVGGRSVLLTWGFVLLFCTILGGLSRRWGVGLERRLWRGLGRGESRLVRRGLLRGQL